MTSETITITDNRTGQSYDLPITYDTIRALDLRQIKVDPEEFGMMTYDPGYGNTAACKSRITYIDGDKGILRYRGYPIEQLAEHSTFLETAYLIIYGELPDKEALDTWTHQVNHHTYVHENIVDLMESFRYDAHPMGMLISSLAFMSTMHPEARNVDDPKVRDKQILRILGKLPTIAAIGYRHRIGRPINYPNSDLSYTANFLYMLDYMGQSMYEVHPTLARALDVLLILHADHEQNCSTSVMRAIGSAHADPYSAMAGATAALFGPRHGGANEAVLRMLNEIGDESNVAAYVEKVKQGDQRLMGFGHRVYKNYDPRARIIKDIAHQVFEVTGSNPLIDIAVALEEVATSDEYFVERKLYPNVDFYSGIIYQAMSFPPDMFTVLFAMGRAPGWLAQWNELVEDPEQRIARPRQIYLGPGERDYVPMDQR
ncbi:MAG: citrate synthase [Caldilineaceae bacterium]|nr:citrate synthase [Caldilineaceae bacterium]MCB9139713.1 citrate synthase [Caldilineaceae bacterium]